MHVIYIARLKALPGSPGWTQMAYVRKAAAEGSAQRIYPPEFYDQEIFQEYCNEFLRFKSTLPAEFHPISPYTTDAWHAVYNFTLNKSVFNVYLFTDRAACDGWLAALATDANYLYAKDRFFKKLLIEQSNVGPLELLPGVDVGELVAQQFPDDFASRAKPTQADIG